MNKNEVVDINTLSLCLVNKEFDFFDQTLFGHYYYLLH